MSERDETIDHLRDAVSELVKEIDRKRHESAILREALELIASAAGNPDPAEACRIIIGIARDALRRAGQDKQSKRNR